MSREPFASLILFRDFFMFLNNLDIASGPLYVCYDIKCMHYFININVFETKCNAILM